jgi:hypothetical protein
VNYQGLFIENISGGDALGHCTVLVLCSYNAVTDFIIVLHFLFLSHIGYSDASLDAFAGVAEFEENRLGL